MANAGYSGTPLIKKLGIAADMKILLLNPPAEYYRWLGVNLNAQLVKKGETPDFVHLFASSQKEYEAMLRSVQPFTQKQPAIIVWASWYKKSAGIPTDLTENALRDFALLNDWVDIKVCAVSDQWSGLKLVVPLAKRGKL